MVEAEPIQHPLRHSQNCDYRQERDPSANIVWTCIAYTEVGNKLPWNELNHGFPFQMHTKTAGKALCDRSAPDTANTQRWMDSGTSGTKHEVEPKVIGENAIYTWNDMNHHSEHTRDHTVQ